MLDLRMLDSILSELIVLNLIVLEQCALPETIPIGCKSGGVVCLNSNPVRAGLGKNSVPGGAAAQAEVHGPRGLAGASVKFGKRIDA
jgi:hypothetical protein